MFLYFTFPRILIYIHQITMKPLSSTLVLRSSSARKPILPLLNLKKDSKQQQNVMFQNKHEIFVKTSCLPIQINYSDQNSSTKTYLSYNLVIIASQCQTKKLALYLQNKDWIRVDFGQTKSLIKVVRTCNENVLTQNTLLGTFQQWERINQGQKINSIYHLKLKSNRDFSIRRKKDRRQSLDFTQKHPSIQLGQSRQAKKHVSSLLAKKFVNKFAFDKSQISKINNIRNNEKLHKNDITSDKTIGDLQSVKNTQSTVSYNHRLSRKSRVMVKNPMQDSILTKNQSNWFSDKMQDQKQPQSLWTLNLDESEIQKRLKKFQTAKLIQIEKINNKIEQNQQKRQTQNPKIVPNDQQVEEEILVQSKVQKDQNHNFSDTFERELKKEKVKEEESDLVESRQLDSSGTIYQSRYQ